MADEQCAGEFESAMPAYLRVEADYGVIICTEHRTAYTPKNISTHLVQSHRAPQSLRKSVQRYIHEQNVVYDVHQPQHGSAPIPGLQVHRGWQCNINNCTAENSLSQSLKIVEDHCSKEHRLNSKRRRGESGAVSQVSIQKWFAKSNKYWVVDFTSINHSAATTPRRPQPIPSSQLSSPFSQSLSGNNISSASTSNFLASRFADLKEKERLERKVLQTPEHTAELTPWNRTSRYQEHLMHLDLDSIPSVYLVPRKVEDHAVLFTICQSVERVLMAAYHELRHLHVVDAKRLNSFQVGVVRQDPINTHQQEHSILKYISTWKRLLCYVYRILVDDPFEQHMFETTDMQQLTFSELCEAARSYPSTNDKDVPKEQLNSDSMKQERQYQIIDRTTLRFCVALLQHRTTEAGGFQSAIMSFCAAASWQSSKTWMSENQCASLLSEMIYCCQLLILAESQRQCRDREVEDTTDALDVLCKQWMHNDSKGPLGDMLRLRLYAMAIARDVVFPSHIRWRRDDETLMYHDLTYRISDLAAEIDYCLQQARLIFTRDLCLGIENIPTFNLADLEDNWDARAKGNSFLTDVRNAGVLEGYETWLFEHIAASADLYRLVVQCANDQDTVGDQVRPAFAREHNVADQKFRVYMAMLLHKGSGQGARIEEFRSLLWCNTLTSIRNLFVHDGYLLFVLSYHKSLHRTHASRYPVRFLLPEVAQLLVQYLVLVFPLRRLFAAEVQIPAKVSEYLWHDGDNVWSAEKLTRISESVSQQAHGTPVNLSTWRQIAVAIAVKKFSGTDYQADLDIPTDKEDDLGGRSILDSWGGAMADVFHVQATHSVRTGNRIYGGTINFERGLTDAGLQEYFKASRLWHQLCRPQVLQQQAGHRRPASSQPSHTINAPLRQKLAHRDRPSRHRLRWGTEQVRYAMRQLLPRATLVTFRSAHQEQLIEAIVTGCPEVVGILATGEGKSWAFLLPSCLPRAGMTIVIVPLVALKTDMVRRCEEAGISYAIWDHSQDSTQYIGTPLLFVSVEQAVRRRFRAFVGQLDAIERLDRVVFDEAHLVLTASSYRPKMSLVRQLRQLYCQVVFLTATLPPSMQAQFESRLLLNKPRVIRSGSFRRDIVCRVKRSSDANLIAYVARNVRRMMGAYQDDSSARLIIYTPTRKEADDLSKRLACPKYYSDSGDAEEKQRAMEQWRAGHSIVMVATSAFGMGIDFPSVRQVVHVGAPTDMIGFSQEIGRLSRDGRGGCSRIILPRNWCRPHLPSLVDQRRSAVSEMAMLVYLNDNRCLSAVISRFLDGANQMQYCQASDPQLRCSKCEQFGIFDSKQEQDDTYWWDADSGSGQVASSEEDENGDTSSVWAGEEDDTIEGPQRLRDHMREASLQRERYEERLEMFQGRCMICMILGQGQIPSTEQWHSLDRCRHIQRRQFLQAKHRAIQRNQDHGGWLKAYVACFRCGNPQEICSVDDTRGPGQTCRFRDLVLPAAWALFHCEHRWGRTLGQITGVSSRHWESEDRWMDWLGMECELWGIRACQAARMMDSIMSLEVGAELP